MLILTLTVPIGKKLLPKLLPELLSKRILIYRAIYIRRLVKKGVDKKGRAIRAIRAIRKIRKVRKVRAIRKPLI